MMVIGIMILVVLPEIASATTEAFVFSINGLGCTGTVFETNCVANPDQGLFSSIACKVMSAINHGVIPVYCNLIGNPDYVMAVNAAVALYVVLWGVMAVAGMTHVSMGQAFIKLLKVMFVFALVMNASFYFEFVYSFVMQAPAQVVRILLESSGSGGQNFFEHVDKKMFEMINSTVKPQLVNDDGSSYQAFDIRMIMLAAAAWKLIPSIGEYIFSFFFFTLLSWIFAYISIVVRYLVAIVALNFLLVLGPIFLPTILFEKTKFLGDEWIKMLVSYMVQIVVVIAFVLMVEDIYEEFTDLIKTGINETVLDKDYEYNAVKVAGDADAVQQKYGINMATSEKYVTNMNIDVGPGKGTDGGNTLHFATKEEFLKWFLMRLIMMALVSLLTLVFMKDYVPAIAVALGGNLKFTSLFGQGSENVFQHDKADARYNLHGDGAGGRKPANEYKTTDAGDTNLGGADPAKNDD